MDPRKILGVDIDASLEEIQKAYRKQARKHHPDLGGDAWAFQQVQDAFEQLTKSQTSSSSRASSSARAPRPSSAAPNDRSSRRQAGQADSKRPPESSGRRPESSHRDSSGPAAKKANGSKNRNDPRSQGSRKSRKKSEAPLQWKKLFGNELPLQTETSVFILLNCLDVFMTYILLTKPGAFESNPVANYFLHNFGFNGMVIFKLVIVAVVCVIAQIAALKKIRLGQFLLIAGSLLVGYVVVYSVRLYIANFM
jgi:hypothetical protein